MYSLALSTLLASCAVVACCGSRVADLRTEFLVEPLGVDVSQPRFSWKIASDGAARGLTQASYQISVVDDATTEEVWNSGNVTSAKNYLVKFGGFFTTTATAAATATATAALKSDTLYTWVLQVTTSDGQTLGDTATFRTGLLDPTLTGDFAGASWITGGDTHRLMRTEFELLASTTTYDDGDVHAGAHAKDSQLQQATVYVAGIGYYELTCDGKKVGDHELDVGWTGRRVLPAKCVLLTLYKRAVYPRAIVRPSIHLNACTALLRVRRFPR